jgi:hypothetical protein
VPLNQLPASFRTRRVPAELSLRKLAWSAGSAPAGSRWASLLWLAGYTALFLTLAVRSYRREERAKFA